MPTQAFNQLINQNVKWMRQSYGRSHALGWQGEPEEINLCYNIFANFDFNDNYKDKPPARLVRIHPKLSFINVTPARIEKALELYFYLNALRTDIPKEVVFDEETGECNIIRDEAEAMQLAKLATSTFIKDYIYHETFVPSSETFEYSEYSSPYSLTT